MSQEESQRSLFLTQLLADQEAGRVGGLDDYVRAFPNIDAFVRGEYHNLLHAEGTAVHGGRYRVEAELASGGMGDVRLASDLVLERRVVLKSVRGGLESARAVERLQREARVLSRLDHPHVCRILDLFEQDGQWMLVLPFLQGETLAECLDRARAQPLPTSVQLADAPTDLPALVEWFATVADALHAAHEVGVVHRDLKPSNLFVLRDGAPVVLDFGLALDHGDDDQRLTRTGEQLGTPLYMAPEQVDGEPCDARTDVYALGVVLYEALTQARPFEGATRQETFRQIMNAEPRSLRARNRAVPRDLEAVCLKAMARAPKERYASMREFALDLRRVVALQPTVARPASGVRRIVRAVRRRRGLIAGVVVAVCLQPIWMLLAGTRHDPYEGNAASVQRQRDESFRARSSEDSELQAAALRGQVEPFSIDEPRGLLERISVCDEYYRQLDRPWQAIRSLTEVINKLRQRTDWSEDLRAKIAATKIVTMWQRPQAGSRIDLLGWAYLRRGWIRSSIGLFDDAWCDLQLAMPLLRSTGNAHRLANTVQTMAEVLLRQGLVASAEPVLRDAAAAFMQPTFGDDRPWHTDENGSFALEVERAHTLRRSGEFDAATVRYLAFAHRCILQSVKDPAFLPHRVEDLLTQFPGDPTNDLLHALLWHVECELWKFGVRTPQVDLCLQYIARHYPARTQTSAVLHREYVTLIEDWLRHGDPVLAIERMERIDKRWRQRDECPTWYCEFFDGAWFKARVLRERMATARIVEVDEEGPQLVATILADGIASKHPLRDEAGCSLRELAAATGPTPYLVPRALPIAVVDSLRAAGWKVRTSLADCVANP